MAYQAAVITVSDRGARGERRDTSGPAICEMLESAGYEVVYKVMIPDEMECIREELMKCADELGCALVVTTGGTGFSPRDVTPEATLSVIERLTPGLAEAMRAESMRITPHGCLSRGTAGIRGRTLMINLPGSEKAVRENLEAVICPIRHGLDMLYSSGSVDCGRQHENRHGYGMLYSSGLADSGRQHENRHGLDMLYSSGLVDSGRQHENRHGYGMQYSSGSADSGRQHENRHGLDMLFSSGLADSGRSQENHEKSENCGQMNSRGGNVPSLDEWLREAKMDPDAGKVGMYLTHCGVVRETAKARVREGDGEAQSVRGMYFSYDAKRLQDAIEETRKMNGIYYVRVWLNEGHLMVGDDIMQVLIGGDIRPHVIDALQFLVGRIKNECVTEREEFG